MHLIQSPLIKKPQECLQSSIFSHLTLTLPKWENVEKNDCRFNIKHYSSKALNYILQGWLGRRGPAEQGVRKFLEGWLLKRLRRAQKPKLGLKMKSLIDTKVLKRPHNGWVNAPGQPEIHG